MQFDQVLRRQPLGVPRGTGGDSADDYDIRIDGPTGAGVRIKGNDPITRINIFSIDRVQAVEPYIAIHVPPGGEQRWRYTYEFTP